MRKHYLCTFGLLALWPLAQACTPIKQAQTFPITGEQIVSVPGKNLISDPLSLVPFDDLGDTLNQSVKQTFANQGVDDNDVDDFHATALRLEVLGPLDRDGQPLQDLRFLDRVAFTLSAPELDDVVIGESAAAAFAQGVYAYDFAVDTGQNLRAFLAAESMTLDVSAEANDRPNLGCDLKISVAFEVQVNALGLLE